MATFAEIVGIPGISSALVQAGVGTKNFAERIPFPSGLIRPVESRDIFFAELVPFPSRFGGPKNVIYVIEAIHGPKYAVFLTESYSTYTESITATSGHGLLLNETWPAWSESLHVTYKANIGLSETWPNFTESISTGGNTYLIPLSETVGLSESLSIIFTGYTHLVETDSWSESLGVIASHIVDFNETVNITEVLDIAESLTETVPLSEVTAIQYEANVHLPETVPLSESLAISADLHISLSETVPLSESISVSETEHVNLSETVILTESMSVIHSESLSLSEPWPTIGESISVSQTYVVELSETVPLSESIGTQADFTVNLDESVPLTERISNQSVSLYETVPWFEALTIEGQLEKPLCFKSDIDPATSYPTPIDLNVDGIGANAFYSQNSTSNDEDVGMARDANDNATLFDKNLAYTAKLIDWLLQANPVGGNFTCTVTGGATPTSLVWTFTSSGLKILEIDNTYGVVGFPTLVSVQVRKVYGPDGSTIVGEITITNTYSTGVLTSFTSVRNI